MIVVELVGEEVLVELDRDGVATLRRVLDAIENGGHEHLATPAWAGGELSERPLNGGTIVNQMTIGVRKT